MHLIKEPFIKFYAGAPLVGSKGHLSAIGIISIIMMMHIIIIIIIIISSSSSSSSSSSTVISSTSRSLDTHTHTTSTAHGFRWTRWFWAA